MKRHIYILLFTVVLITFFSCEEYLDKAPESNLTAEDVFKDFDHAQGFVEEMYAYVVDIAEGGHWETDYLLGDEAYMNTSWLGSWNIDQGDYFGVMSNTFSILRTDPEVCKDDDQSKANPFERNGIYYSSIYGIRKANLVIENIDLMVNATKKEKDVILGQAYFFRALFHYELMKLWGPYPYIDYVIVTEFSIPRPETYKEGALKVDADFAKAAELLPENWDNEPYGQKTLGENKGRVTKGAAYAFKGKNLLVAASPLMKGTENTYDYDTELCEMAVEAFAEVLKLDASGVYNLVSFENYEEVFWKVQTPEQWPGSTEFIFNCPAGSGWVQRNRFALISVDNKITGQGTHLESPTHNYIYYNFGMSNGLSIEDDLSGLYGPTLYDPDNPFENRDPRFYKWIIVDGDTMADQALSGNDAENYTAKLYTGGYHRSDLSGSKTGYFFKKFFPTYTGTWNQAPLNAAMPWRIKMRLTDVYLMYAEALHAAKKDATVAPTSYPLTAEQAINRIRSRSYVPDVNNTIVSNPNKFMDEIRRERSVELSYEAHRWLDIRRWSLAHLDKYKRKTGLDFPEDHSYFNEFLIVERVCEYPKHFWMPFPQDQTELYPGFKQNPGW